MKKPAPILEVKGTTSGWGQDLCLWCRASPAAVGSSPGRGRSWRDAYSPPNWWTQTWYPHITHVARITVLGMIHCTEKHCANPHCNSSTLLLSILYCSDTWFSGSGLERFLFTIFMLLQFLKFLKYYILYIASKKNRTFRLHLSL